MKKIFSIFLCSALILSLFSFGVHAETHKVTDLTNTDWIIKDWQAESGYGQFDIVFETSENLDYPPNINPTYRYDFSIGYTYTGLDSEPDDNCIYFHDGANGFHIMRPQYASTFLISIFGGSDVKNQKLIDWLYENGELLNSDEEVEEYLTAKTFKYTEFTYELGLISTNGYSFVIKDISGFFDSSEGADSFNEIHFGYNGVGIIAPNYITFVNGDLEYVLTSEHSVTIIFDTDFFDQSVFDALISTATSYSGFCDGSGGHENNDIDNDNLCDDCQMAVMMTARIETPTETPNYPYYNFNGVNMPITVENADGKTASMIDLYNKLIKPQGGSLVIVSHDGDIGSALLYHFNKPLAIYNGNVATPGTTNLVLYKVAYTDDGKPYWKFSAEDTWNQLGATVSPIDTLFWSADDINDLDGNVVIKGDSNFRLPPAEVLGEIVQAEATTISRTIGNQMMILALCGVGCLALLISLYLLSKKLRTYLP